MTPELMATIALRSRWSERAVEFIHKVVEQLQFEDYTDGLDLIEDYPE